MSAVDYTFRGCLITNKPCQDGANCGLCQVAKKFLAVGGLNEYDRDNFYLFERSVMLGEVAVFTNRTQTVGCLASSLLARLQETAPDKVSCDATKPDDSNILKYYPLFDKVKRVNGLGEPEKVYADPAGNLAAVFVYGEKCFLVAPQVVRVGREGGNRG